MHCYRRGWFAAGLTCDSRLARNSAEGSALSRQTGGIYMARAGLLWLLGIPIPILLIMWVFGWL
jgi:hypothetical protein